MCTDQSAAAVPPATIAPYRESDLPYLTADLVGTGGRIKRFDDDFVVAEQPLYEPSGNGTHVYFGIEKRGMTTWNAINRIARSLGRRPAEIGYAGLKDAHAVTRQMLSLEHVAPEAVARVDLDNIRILSTDRHTNKLKLGHLAGNSFTIRIRDVDSKNALERAETILDVLSQRGVPNYFGPQRFGIHCNNAQIGAAVLKGHPRGAIDLIVAQPLPDDAATVRAAKALAAKGRYAEAAKAFPPGSSFERRMCQTMSKWDGHARKTWRSVDHSVRKLYLCAVQSQVFNLVLARRIDRVDRIEAGDVAWKHANGACFSVTDAAVEQPRCDAFEISASGPLFGPRMKAAGGAPGDAERAALADCGLTQTDFEKKEKFRFDGARRPLRVPINGVRSGVGRDRHGDFLELTFSLPPGSYATSTIREACKTEVIRE